MIISCNLFFIWENYLYSTLWSTINYHFFFPRRKLHADVTDRELNFADTVDHSLVKKNLMNERHRTLRSIIILNVTFTFFNICSLVFETSPDLKQRVYSERDVMTVSIKKSRSQGSHF